MLNGHGHYDQRTPGAPAEAAATEATGGSCELQKDTCSYARPLRARLRVGRMVGRRGLSLGPPISGGGRAPVAGGRTDPREQLEILLRSGGSLIDVVDLEAPRDERPGRGEQLTLIGGQRDRRAARQQRHRLGVGVGGLLGDDLAGGHAREVVLGPTAHLPGCACARDRGARATRERGRRAVRTCMGMHAAHVRADCTHRRLAVHRACTPCMCIHAHSMHARTASSTSTVSTGGSGSSAE